MAKSKARSERDAHEMLMQDHERILRYFKDFESVDRSDAEAVRELVETVCLELQIHSLLEEEIFYPAVREQVRTDADDDLLNESEIEHESVDALIARLHGLEPDDPLYRACFAVVMAQVKRHIEVEEQQLFTRLKAFEKLELAGLGEEMRQRREALFAEMEEDEGEEDDDDPLAGIADDDSVPEPEDDGAEDEEAEPGISRTRH